MAMLQCRPASHAIVSQISGLLANQIFFYSNEGDPREPLHIHVRKGEPVAKFWLVPQVSLAESCSMSSGELRELIDIIEDKRDLIERYWHETFDI